jgi:hypothetical protein
MFEEPDIYNIDDFSDKEIINNILDLNNPSDRELEAKIIMMIDKHSDKNTNTYDEKLSKFFNDIYKRFFVLEEEEEEEDGDESESEETKITEGLTTMNKDKKKDDKPSGGEPAPDNKKKLSVFNDDSTMNIRTVDYREGWLNPLIKESVKRVIFLDSQFRDTETYPLSTDYTFNLSEPLIDVLSLKLHSVIIPYSWYTIGRERGANYFTLKGMAPGIDDGYHDIKIDIEPGCYANVTQLVTAVETSMQNLPNLYPDVSFNNVHLTYDQLSTFATLTIDITSTYTVNKLIFPTITSPLDKDINRMQTIPGFLGFLNDQYSSTEIYSNPEYVKPKTIVSSVNSDSILEPIDLYYNDVFQLYEDGDHPNNFFTVHVVYSYKTVSIIVKLPTSFSPFKAKTQGSPRRYTREALCNMLNKALSTTPELEGSSIELINVRYQGKKNTSNVYQTYKLNIILNRNTVLHTESMRQYITFPEEPNDFPIWTGIYSCFMFDKSYLQPLYKEIGVIDSEYSPMEMNYIVYSSPYIVLKCVVDDSYTYRVNIKNSSTTGYTKEEYIQELNDAFFNQSINFDISMNILIEEDISKNCLKFIVDIYKNMDEYTNITELDYEFEFYDENGHYADIHGNKYTSWEYYLGMTSESYSLDNSMTKNLHYSEFYAENPIRDAEIELTAENNEFHIEQNGIIDKFVLTPGIYTTSGLYSELNKQFSLNPSSINNNIKKVIDPNTKKSVSQISLKTTRTYTTKDYALVFYDALTKGSCDVGNKGERSLGHTTWDYTLGWILGFRRDPSYNMDVSLYSYGLPSGVTIDGNTFTLVGNTAVNVNLINQCFIVLDDYTQNHLNDGVVTMTNSDKSIPLPSYSNRATFRCDPTTGRKVPSYNNSLTRQNLTQRLLYAAEQINLNSQQTLKYYSDPPYVKDMFALIPLKIPSTQGDSFVEYGGTLQDNDRKYFGAVNISRFRVKLLTDRGDVINLQNRNWSISIVVECKYTANKNEVNTNVK